MTESTAEPDNPAAYALARHIADHPVSTIQAAFRYLNAPLGIELHEDPAAPATDQAGARFSPGEGVHGQDPYYAATDQAALVKRVAAALQEHGMVHLNDPDLADEYDCCAEAAILAVLPAPAENHRLALSEALGLGTGAPWDAIHDRARTLRTADESAREGWEQAAIQRSRATAWRKEAERAAAEVERLRIDRAAVLERIREVVRRLAAHAVGFQDVLDESDRGPWARTVGADIAALVATLEEVAAL